MIVVRDNQSNTTAGDMALDNNNGSNNPGLIVPIGCGQGRMPGVQQTDSP